MPLIEADNWTVGPARVRASSPDPYAGLRGHAYIAARGLNKPVQRLDTGVLTDRARTLFTLVARQPVCLFPRRARRSA